MLKNPHSNARNRRQNLDLMADQPQQADDFTSMDEGMVETGDKLLGSVEGKQVSTRELLNRNVQELIEEVNSKRKRDSALLTDFKRTMEEQCNNTCNSVEAAMYNIYELTNRSVEEKLQELSTVLERIAKLEVELEDFKMALSALYTDVHSQD